MKSIVLMKPIPFNYPGYDQTGYSQPDRNKGQILNPADMNALEAALELKDNYGGEVLAVSMGSCHSEKLLRQALAMGADEAYLLCDSCFAGSDTLMTATVLHQAIHKIGAFDIILCGYRTTDGETGQVGPELAALLGISCVTHCVAFRLDRDRLICERYLEQNREVLSAPVPSIVTLKASVNLPRLPTIKGLQFAEKAEIPKWDHKILKMDPLKCGLLGSPTQVVKIEMKPLVKRTAKYCIPENEGYQALYKFLKEISFEVGVE